MLTKKLSQSNDDWWQARWAQNFFSPIIWYDFESSKSFQELNTTSIENETRNTNKFSAKVVDRDVLQSPDQKKVFKSKNAKTQLQIHVDCEHIVVCIWLWIRIYCIPRNAPWYDQIGMNHFSFLFLFRFQFHFNFDLFERNQRKCIWGTIQRFGHFTRKRRFISISASTCSTWQIKTMW